jgi:hypothetical protein
MQWLAWWKMCIPKDRGGMSFQHLHTLNTALLVKQSWRLMEEPDSLCARVIREKYYPDENLLKAKIKCESYFMLQSTLQRMKAFNPGRIWRVSQGDQINVWEYPWIPTVPTRKVYIPKVSIVMNKFSYIISLIMGHGMKRL